MYLAELNQVEKEKFLELVYKVANSDKVYTDSEIQILKKFKKELGIDIIPSKTTLDELLRYFAEASTAVQKIVYFEVYGMILADEGVTGAEAGVIEKMEGLFGIEDEAMAKIRDAANSLKTAYELVNAAVK